MKHFGISLLFIVIGLFSFAQSEITTEKLKSHVSYLASDKLEGRYPGTSGDLATSKYIIDYFKSLNLKLLADGGKQPFQINSDVKVGDKTLFQFKKQGFALHTDFIPYYYSANKTLQSEVVFLGYGFDIANDSINWNDYATAKVSGKWVMILRGDPYSAAKTSKYSVFSDDASKVASAKKHGAAGVIFVNSVVYDANDELVKTEKQRPGLQSDLVVIQIKRKVANIMLADNGITIENYEKKINSSLKPNIVNIGSKAKAITNLQFTILKTANVVAMLEGTDPILKNEYVIIGAHMDHLGWGGPQTGSRTLDTLAIHNGADDNASGVAAVLELAAKLTSDKNNLKRSFIFIAFAAEEKGLLGSKFFVNNPLIDLSKVKIMINLDMIGRLGGAEKSLLVGGVGTATELNDLVDAKAEGLRISKSMSGYGPSDHASFYGKNIPVLYCYTGAHPDYHTPNDDVEFIDFDGVKKISDFIYSIVTDAAISSGKYTYLETGLPPAQGNRTSLKVTLGIMPDFSGDTGIGMRVDGVRNGGPAEIAGMLKGDIITAINGVAIHNIQEYMASLSKFSKGDVVPVEVLRGEAKSVLLVEL